VELSCCRNRLGNCLPGKSKPGLKNINPQIPVKTSNPGRKPSEARPGVLVLTGFSQVANFSTGIARTPLFASVLCTYANACSLLHLSVPGVDLYKTFVYLVNESTFLSFPPPTCIAHPGAILLHDYWTVYDSPSDHPCVCYKTYDIGDTNIV